MKARVIEFHIDFTTAGAGDPLLTSAGTGAVITILHSGDTGTGTARQRAPTARLPARPAPRGESQVSQTFTLITSLRTW